MTTIVEFSAARKAMIRATKALLTNPENQKIERNRYGNKFPKLCFQDYLVYAVLRGANYEKAAHEQSLGWAKSELRAVQNEAERVASKENAPLTKLLARYIPEGVDGTAELKELIEAALAKKAA